MSRNVLSGVVALVSFRPDKTFNFKQTVSTKLTDLGARVTSRFSRDVTHVVFQKRLKPTPEQQVAEASDLRALYDKAAKAETPVHIVSLLWVERSAADKNRAMEQKYTMPRPTDADLLGLGAGITPGSSGRKRSRRTMQPRDTKQLEVDVTDAMFSSSQQINGQQKPGLDLGDVSSPAPQAEGRRQKAAQQALTKYVRYAGKLSEDSKPQAGAKQEPLQAELSGSLLHVAPVKAGHSIADALGRQKGKKALALGSAASAGQQNKPVSQTGKRKRQDPQTGTSDCCTPELSRLQLPSTRHTASKAGMQSVPCSRVHPKTTGKQVPKAAEQAVITTSSPRKGTRAARQAQSRQDTRLASCATAADVQGKAVSERQSAQEKIGASCVPDSRCGKDDDMPDATADVGASGVEAETMLPPAVGTDTRTAASSSGQQHARMASAVPVLLPGGSSRFSTRRLQQKVDAKLPVSKATPVGLPPTPLMPSDPQAAVIPVPNFTRVPSPWTSTPEDLPKPSAADGADQPQPPAAASNKRPAPSLPTSAMHPSQAAAVRDQQRQQPAATPAGPGTAATATQVPWSACRLWDPNPLLAAASQGAQATEPQRQQFQRSQPSRMQGDTKQCDSGRGGDNDEDTEVSEAGVDARDEEQGQGSSTSGCLGLSCVEGEVQEVARNAVRALRGIRLCAEGHEEGRLTHLVLGQQRRTLKVLLAIAAGAMLVTPEWLTASVEAGEWLPEEPFLAQGRFAEAAFAARGGNSGVKPLALLHGKRVYVHVAEAAKKGPSSGNGGALRRLVAALGGKIYGAKGCDLCIVSGGCSRPSNLSSDVIAVREEWLLNGSEQYKLESERLHAVR